MLLMRLRVRDMLENLQSGAHDRMIRDSRSVDKGKAWTARMRPAFGPCAHALVMNWRGC